MKKFKKSVESSKFLLFWTKGHKKILEIKILICRS